MKQIMKQALKDAFEAPEPVGKQAFFKTIRPVKISHIYSKNGMGVIRDFIWHRSCRSHIY